MAKRITFSVAALLLGMQSAPAQTRPDSLAMTCAQVNGLVKAQGAVVIGTGQYIFDRYVTDRRFCPTFDTTKPAWLRTRDKAQCFVGYTCIPAEDYLLN